MSSTGWALVETRRLFDMLGDPRAGHGLLGVSDPDIHWRDGGWSMFLGAVTTKFVVRMFEARLPAGAAITDDRWRFVTDARGRAAPLGAPRRGGGTRPAYTLPATCAARRRANRSNGSTTPASGHGE